jgi:electron transfer flavoprotein alpha subunit
MSDILVFIEHKNCVLNRTSVEAITAAQNIGRDLGLKVSAVIPCNLDCSLAGDISQYALDKVIVVKNEKLSIYTPDGYADAWKQVIKAVNPRYIVMAHTYQVRDFAPKVAAGLGKEVVGDCIRYRAENGTLVLTRRMFLGKLDADVKIGGGPPYFITLAHSVNLYRNVPLPKPAQILEDLLVCLQGLRLKTTLSNQKRFAFLISRRSLP